MENFKVGSIIKCNTIGHESSGIVGTIESIDGSYGVVKGIQVNLNNCVHLVAHFVPEKHRQKRLDEIIRAGELRERLTMLRSHYLARVRMGFEVPNFTKRMLVATISEINKK